MISKINDADIEEIVKIESDLFGNSAWNKEQFLYEMNENPFSFIYVLKKNEIVKGYIDLWITYDTAQIANLGVAREEWRKGYATKLMQYAIGAAIHEQCENITLEIRVSNEKAISLYEKFGFIRINIRKHYYENGEDAYLMMKPIGGMTDDDITGN